MYRPTLDGRSLKIKRGPAKRNAEVRGKGLMSKTARRSSNNDAQNRKESHYILGIGASRRTKAHIRKA
jgi:hypothetical protein